MYGSSNSSQKSWFLNGFWKNCNGSLAKSVADRPGGDLHRGEDAGQKPVANALNRVVSLEAGVIRELHVHHQHMNQLGMDDAYGISTRFGGNNIISLGLKGLANLTQGARVLVGYQD
jgi:hypothetical protein